MATEIDFDFTCVGGSDALINELLEHPRLEVLRAELEGPRPPETPNIAE